MFAIFFQMPFHVDYIRNHDCVFSSSPPKRSWEFYPRPIDDRLTIFIFISFVSLLFTHSHIINGNQFRPNGYAYHFLYMFDEVDVKFDTVAIFYS